MQWHIEECHMKMEEATGSDTAMKQGRSGTTKNWKSLWEKTLPALWFGTLAFKNVRKSTSVT